MPQVAGIDVQIHLIEETTYGQLPATPSSQLLYFTRFGVTAQRNNVASATLRAGRGRQQPIPGNWDVQGQIETELDSAANALLLKHAIGQVTTTGAGPFSHALTIGSLPVGLTIEKDHGAAIAGAGRVERFSGCRVNGLTISVPVEGVATARYDIIGSSYALDAAVSDSTPTDTGFAPFSSFEVSAINEGGAALAVVQSAEISLANNLDGDTYTLGSGGVRRALNEGLGEISGRVTALFEDATLLNKAINSTNTSLQLTFSRGTGDGSAGNESLDINCYAIRWEVASPPVDGPGGLTVDMNFIGFSNATGNGLTVTLNNALSAI